ncbi:hypothetical protein [Oceanobacillus chungangensis]|uniref:WYL domain-containing protein n=1 Tax=Oceanobacillus chungangensis TaxID=1229152 RepID=A0A3D8PK57_9BACI|nr:hypothetical protein [Oceanobacillus chungangensis]RDW15867.1 hypothetical protein CWR45_16075 [Oceanobacillus chungangensis]
MKGLIMRSKDNKEKIMIFYIDSNNNVAQRIIRVIDINDESIIAFCFLRKKVRTFNHKNILSAGPVRKRVTA